MQKTHVPRYAIIKIYSVQPPSKSSMKMEMNDSSNANTPLEMPTLGCTPFLVGGNSQEAAFKVLIIIRFLRSSVTRRRRLFNTVSMVSTTLIEATSSTTLLRKASNAELGFLAMLDDGHDFGCKGNLLEMEIYRALAPYQSYCMPL
jgi:hypothetical protein